MAQGRSLKVSALNISATPHPAGIYVDLLKKAAGKKANFRGNDWAKFTKPVESDTPGVFTGRILVWTEIDTRGPWLDDETDDLLSPADKATISIPKKAKPNYRTFNYVFRVDKHRLYFEAGNEFGDQFGTTMAQRVFYNLLVGPALARKIDIDVTVVPKSGAVNTVLALPGLRSLHIRVIVPNSDTTSDAKRRRVLKRLEDAQAKQLDEIYTKRAGEDRLVATPEIWETAEVAATDGFVKGVGRKNGKRVETSTTRLPRTETIPVDEPGANFLSRLLGSIGLF